MDEIVANVEVGLVVSVEIAEHHGQTPIPRGIGQGLTLLVEKQTHIPRGNDHVGSAAVDVERIGFSAFEDLQIAIERRNSEVALLRFNHRAAVGLTALNKPPTLGRVMEGVETVVGDVQVEVAVAIDIGQSH